MTSITVNLTLEQVLEFVQNLPLEYKKAVKQKLETEQIEEINQSENITLTISDEKEEAEIVNNEQTIEQSKKSIVDEIAGIIKDDNMPDYKTMRDAAIVARYKDKLERADREQEEKDKEANEIAERRVIVERLGGSLKVDLGEDFDYKEEYRKLIIKKYTQE
jgi:hypothetical protein